MFWAGRHFGGRWWIAVTLDALHKQALLSLRLNIVSIIQHLFNLSRRLMKAEASQKFLWMKCIIY
jgi:hypothetical protein